MAGMFLESGAAGGSAARRPEGTLFCLSRTTRPALKALDCFASDFRGSTTRGVAAFPLNELYIAIVLIVLIAIGLYFFAGAWGVFLLWCLALLFVVPQGLATLALVEGSGEERGKGKRGSAAALLAGAVLWFLSWLAGTAYCARSAYLAYQALP
jgi:hypothetical protein